jgi:hypothetical protein
LFSEVDEAPIPRSWCTFTAIPNKKAIVLQGGYSKQDSPLDDKWILDFSNLYKKGTGGVKWNCIRHPTIPDPNGNTIEEDSYSPFRRLWHTANAVNSVSSRGDAEAILVYGGLRNSPAVDSTCLRDLYVDRLCPSSLFNICMRSLQTYHLHNLPTNFSVLNFKRKLTLLHELQRFKQRTIIHNRDCPSLIGLNLGEIFDVTDPFNFYQDAIH